MDSRKLIAGSTLVFLLTGCQLWDQITGTATQIASDKAPKEVIMDAFSKMQNEVKQSHGDTTMDLVINSADPKGAIKVSLTSSEDQAALKEKGDLSISFLLDGEMKDSVTQDGGPESGKATLTFARENLNLYFKVNELKIEPEEMNSFVEMFFPDITKSWFYLDLTKMEGMEGIDTASLENFSVADGIARSIVNAAEQNGAPISEEAAKKIAAKILSGEYLEVINTKNVDGNVVYTTKIDYEGLKTVIKEIVDIVSQETGETMSTDEEAELEEVIDQFKAKTSDLEIEIAINNEGYLAGVSSDFTYKFEGEDAENIESIAVNFDMKISKYNEDFGVSIPTDYQDLTSTIESLTSSPYVDDSSYNFDSEMGFEDFYPCDVYGCTEETENQVVDTDGDTWVKGDDGQWTLVSE